MVAINRSLEDFTIYEIKPHRFIGYEVHSKYLSNLWPLAQDFVFKIKIFVHQNRIDYLRKFE